MPHSVPEINHGIRYSEGQSEKRGHGSEEQSNFQQLDNNVIEIEKLANDAARCSTENKAETNLAECTRVIPPNRRRIATIETESTDDPNADLDMESDTVTDSGPQGVWSFSHNISRKVFDSKAWAMLSIVLVLVDTAFFLLWLIILLGEKHPLRFEGRYRVMDWVTAVTFLVEVPLRCFSGGLFVYFRSTLRTLDLAINAVNFCAIVAIEFPKTPQSLKVTRFLRLLRVIMILAMLRGRTFKTRRQIEVEELELLLDLERSNQNKLTKWRIESEAIAVGDSAGEGGFGAVYLGLFRGTLVAVKQLFETDTRAHATSIADEAVTLVNLRHPNVVLFMGFVHEPSRLWIVTEYCSRGSLHDLLDDERMVLTHSRILKFALGAARGLAYLHGQEPEVLHLDLKTSNILISSGWDTKLADFGLARSADKPQNNKFGGTIQYCAPEILDSNTFGTAADIYAFGICLWEIAAREIPFHGTPKMDLLVGVAQRGMRPNLSQIKPKNSQPELPSKLRLEEIEVREASTLEVLTSIASSQSGFGCDMDHVVPIKEKNELRVAHAGEGEATIGSPVTPPTEANHTWDTKRTEAKKFSESSSTLLSTQREGPRRQSAPSFHPRATRPALAANATQPVTQDHSGNSYSAGEVAEATQLVHELADLNDDDSFAKLIERGRYEPGPVLKFASDPGSSHLAHAIASATPDERYMYYKARRQTEQSHGRQEKEEREQRNKIKSDGGYVGGRKHGAVEMCSAYCDLIELCWAQDPAARPSADEVVWRIVSMIDNDLKTD